MKIELRTRDTTPRPQKGNTEDESLVVVEQKVWTPINCDG